MDHAPLPTPRINIFTTKTGTRVLQVALRFPTLMTTVAYNDEQPDKLFWEITPFTARGRSICDARLRVGPNIRTYPMDTNVAPRMVFATSLEDLSTALAHTGVVGRHCQQEWRWTAGHRAHLKVFLARVYEEKRWQEAGD